MKLKERLKEYRIAILYYVYRKNPICSHKAVFCNYNGKGFGCNPKYIALEMMKRNKNWDIVWIVKNAEEQFPNGIRTVMWDSKEAIYELATAAVWVDNQRKLWYHRKRKKQFFLETWHGAGIPMKKIGADNPNNYHNKPYKHTSLHMNKIVNLMISNSIACTQIFHRAFLYKGKILNCGYPRNDILVGNRYKYRQLIREKYGISIDTNIILYAPTYRNGRKLDKYNLDYDRVLNAVQNKFGGKWVAMLRFHPTINNLTLQQNNIINVTDYSDMQELMAGSDLLISDYSSVITEFALTEQPVFLYSEDVDEYVNERDFYINYFSLPFPIAQNNEEMIDNINNFEYRDYIRELKLCLEQYGVIEHGNAASTVVDIIENNVV